MARLGNKNSIFKFLTRRNHCSKHIWQQQNDQDLGKMLSTQPYLLIDQDFCGLNNRTRLIICFAISKFLIEYLDHWNHRQLDFLEVKIFLLCHNKFNKDRIQIESIVTNVVEPACTNVPISISSIRNVPEYGAYTIVSPP